jgi:Fur family ferric uptake transcriptional regulator
MQSRLHKIPHCKIRFARYEKFRRFCGLGHTAQIAGFHEPAWYAVTWPPRHTRFASSPAGDPLAGRIGSVEETPASRYQDYIDRLQHLGVRITAQRVLVLDALASHGGHMTAEEIMRRIEQRHPRMNLATVYRTLDLLLSLGLVAQTDLGGGAASFELVGDEPHHHLVCERCNAVMELDDRVLAPVREQLLRQYGFQAHSRHIAIFGLCRECRKAQPGAR